MIKLGFDDLTPTEAHKLLDFYASMRGTAGASQSIQGARYSDIERTAAELVGNAGHATAPIAAPAAGAAPYQVDSSPNVPPPPPPPAAPAAAPSPAVSVPGGAPNTGHSTAPVDARGVPFNAEHHSGTPTAPGRNADGTWKRRRGHDPKALQAYEADFLPGGRGVTPAANHHAGHQQAATMPASPNGGAPASTAPSPVGGGQPAPVAPAMMGQQPDPNSPMSWPPAPPPPSVVSFEEFARLWTALCAAQRVSVELETWIKTTHGGHPTLSDVFRHNPMARGQVYEVLRGYDVPAAA